MIAKRLPVWLFEHVVETATGRGGHRSDWKASARRYELVERRNSIRAAVSIGIDHHKTGLAERNAGHRLGIFAPPAAHALRVGAHGLPALYDWLLLPPAVLEIDADCKHRDAGFGEVERGLEIARLNVGRGCSIERKRLLFFDPLGCGRRR